MIQPYYIFILNLINNLILSLNVSDINYCKDEYQCKIRNRIINNTACNCPMEDLKRCGNSPIVQKPSLNDTFKNYIIDAHNSYRELIASGEETKIGNIGATDMMALDYDEELEHLAWCYSHKCNDEGDYCRVTQKFDHVGQNQFIWFDGKPCDSSTIDAALEFWYKEIDFVENGRSCVISSKCNMEEVGRFTQMIWAKTTHVGCALTEYLDKGTDTMACNVFCNYGPAGNERGARIYTLGHPARDCITRDSKFLHLCIGKEPQQGKHEVEGVNMVVTSQFLLWSSFGAVLTHNFLIY